ESDSAQSAIHKISLRLSRHILLYFFASFFFYSSGDHRDLHSFPTRRSSDLNGSPAEPAFSRPLRSPCARRCGTAVALVSAVPHRSEEHTSELQSRGHLVCRLLLEKKKRGRLCHLRCLCAGPIGPSRTDRADS